MSALEAEQSYSDDFEDEVEPSPVPRSPDQLRARTRTGASEVGADKGRAFVPGPCAAILLDRIGRSRGADPFRTSQVVVGEPSVTYATLRENVESWSVGHDSRTSLSSEAGDASFGVVTRRHVLDRLAIESLTLSMRNYGEGGGTPLQQSLAAMPVTGLLRMARVVERKALSLDRPSAERIEEIYDPVFLCGELARSQREVAARFLS